MTITPEQIDMIEHAAALLDGEAIAMHRCNTVDGDYWPGDEDAKRSHDDMKSTSVNLYTIAGIVRAMRANSIITENALKNAQAELAKPKPRR